MKREYHRPVIEEFTVDRCIVRVQMSAYSNPPSVNPFKPRGPSSVNEASVSVNATASGSSNSFERNSFNESPF